jgi:tRNA nucleotidyltransferase (CCA-adding enzyme)
MIRAARFSARLGWQLEEKTQQRYDTGKTEGYISALNPTLRNYELEEIFHEEDPLRVLRRLEAEGWAKVLFPAWTSAKVNEAELDRLRDTVGQLESMDIHPDPSAAYFPLLTAKLAPKDVAALKKSFARPGFADQIDALDADTKTFATQFTGKSAAAPSDAWKLLFTAPPEPVLWLAHTTKSAPLQAKFKAFFGDWSQARLKIPYQLMQEMRITPSLPGYDALIEQLFFAVMDGKLDTPEATRAFLEPFSPPAPPPPVNMRRRAVKRETKVPKPRTKKAAAAEAAPDDLDIAAAAGSPSTPKPPAPAKPTAAKPAPAAKPAASKPASVPAAAKVAPAAAKKAAPAKPAAKPAPAKNVAAKKPTKPAAKKTTKPAPKPVAKKVPSKKAAAKPAAKKAANKVAKPAPAKKKPTPKPAAKKAVVKAAAKKPAKKTAKPAPKPKSKTASKPKPKSKR